MTQISCPATAYDLTDAKRNPHVDEKSRAYRYLIEGIMFLTYMVFGMCWSAAGTFLKDVMKELSLTLSQAGFISTSVSVAKFVGPIVAGFIAEKFGMKKAFLVASGLICLGIFSPFAESYSSLLWVRFGMGLGGALVVVYLTPITMQWFDSGERITMNGFNSISISVGMMLGLTFTRPLMRFFNGSWKTVLLYYSAASIVLFAAWLLWGKEGPLCTPPSKKAKSNGNTYVEALKDPVTWKLIFSYSGLLSVYVALITYFPTYYQNCFTVHSYAHYAPAVVMLTGIPASMVGAAHSKQAGLRIPCIKISGLLLIPGILGMFLFKDAWLVIISAVVTGFGIFLLRSPFFTIPQELPGSSVEKVAHMMGLFWAASYIVATFNTWFVGRVIEQTDSFEKGFLYVAAASSTLLFGSFLIPETGPGAKN